MSERRLGCVSMDRSRSLSGPSQRAAGPIARASQHDLTVTKSYVSLYPGLSSREIGIYNIFVRLPEARFAEPRDFTEQKPLEASKTLVFPIPLGPCRTTTEAPSSISTRLLKRERLQQ